MIKEKGKSILFWSVYSFAIIIIIAVNLITDFFESSYLMVLFGATAIVSFLSIFANILLKTGLKESAKQIIKDWKKILLIGSVLIIVITDILVFFTIAKSPAPIIILAFISMIWGVAGVMYGGMSLMIFLIAMFVFRLGAKSVYIPIATFCLSMLAFFITIINSIVLS